MTEMPDPELRGRLSRIDPAPAGSPVDPVTGPLARERMERAMQTADLPTPTEQPSAGRRRRPWLLAAAAAVLIAVAGVGVTLAGQDAPRRDEAPTALALELPPADVAGSCLAFEVRYLAAMPVALAGTVTAVDPGRVTLDVDRWYRGGTADAVTIAVHEPNSVALDGVDFRAGQRYLITATDGTVNGCGFSGPATPGLERAFAAAFGG